MEHNYICIQCGKSAPALYREYTKELLKMCHCENCMAIIDSYTETEASIIFIDAILQRKQAYRHILYNSKVKFVWKLAIVFLLCDAYQKWITDRAILWNTSDNFDSFIYFELEWNFYLACLKAAIENLLFLFFIIISISIIYRKKIYNRRDLIKNLLNGLVIFSYGKVFYLPAVLWGMNGSTTEFFITAFVIISEIQTCIVVFDTSKLLAFIIVVSSFILHRVASITMYRFFHN